MAHASIPDIRANLYDLVASPAGDVAVGALLIAAEEYPELEIERYLDYLGELSERVRDSAGAAPDEAVWRSTFAEQIFEREGFAGNANEYDDPRNSYLNDVIDRRRGIPITLAIVYLAVAHRLGRPVAGVNAPGHFLLRHGDVVIDPFNGGQVVDVESLVARLEQQGATDPRRSLASLLRHPPDTRAILTRVLANLRVNHLRRGDTERALQVVDRLVRLDPTNPAWLRDRGVLFRHLDCARAAVDDLERYLEQVPQDPEAEAIRSLIIQLSKNLPPVQ